MISSSHPIGPLQEKLLGHLGVVLYEYLGEEYPEVLGSILGGLKVKILKFKKNRFLFIIIFSGNCECDWNDEDDSSHQRSSPQTHPNPEKQVSPVDPP